MVESIKELRKICQRGRVVKGRSEQHWINLFYRRFSIYFTWLFLHTPLSANQITALNFFLALIGGFLISLGNYWLALVAVLILYLINVLDHVDGEVSRYRKSSSRKGGEFDGLVDVLIHPVFFIGLSLASFNLSGNPVFFVLGSVIILFYLANKLLKGVSREYETKEFHKSPCHSINLITKNPISMLIFMGSSKHFIDLLILLSTLFFVFPLVLIFFSILTPLSFLLGVYKFMKS